jgi:hypothetical protein
VASKFSDYEIIRMGGQGIQSSALTPDQRKLAYRVRTLANTPWEDLSNKEKKLMIRVADEYVTPAQIAKYTRISKNEIMRGVNMKRWHGINQQSLVFKASRGFYGKTNDTSKTVVLSGESSPMEGEYITFQLPDYIEDMIRDKRGCDSPPCGPNNTVRRWIPLKHGVVRDNMTVDDYEAMVA